MKGQFIVQISPQQKLWSSWNFKVNLIRQYWITKINFVKIHDKGVPKRIYDYFMHKPKIFEIEKRKFYTWPKSRGQIPCLLHFLLINLSEG